MTSNKAVKVFGVLLVFGVLNVIAFSAEINALGGTAFFGSIEEGKYYLGQGGDLNRVSSTSYYFNLAHGIVLIAHFIVVFVLGLWLKWTGQLNE